MSDLKELSNLQKYNGKEYNLWKFQAQAFLDGRGFMGIVDGSERMPVLPSLQSSTPVPEIQFGRSFSEMVTPAPEDGMSPEEREASLLYTHPVGGEAHSSSNHQLQNFERNLGQACFDSSANSCAIPVSTARDLLQHAARRK